MTAYEKKIMILLGTILCVSVGLIGYLITDEWYWWLSLIPVFPLSLSDEKYKTKLPSTQEKIIKQ